MSVEPVVGGDGFTHVKAQRHVSDQRKATGKGAKKLQSRQLSNINELLPRDDARKGVNGKYLHL